MIGIRDCMVFLIVAFSIAEAAKRNAQCDFVCQGKMTIECCECIGCHQGMRFGKRSVSSNIPELEDDREDLSTIDDVLVQIENELSSRPRRFFAKIIH